MQRISKNISGVILALISMILIAAASSPEAAAKDPAQHILSSVQDITGVPGMSAAVSDHGKIIWSGTAGHIDADRQTPVDLQTRFRIASVSKLFTAALALKLAEDGVLDLDADIRTYVPEWPGHDGAVITLRQLAAHISGVGHYGADDRYDPSKEYRSLTEAMTIYGHKPLQSAPGEAYSYSSYGYALMGAAIERATGDTLENNLTEHLFKPLNLKHTSIERIEAIPENTSALFLSSGARITRNDQHHVVGATGVLSTPIDLLAFANAYSAGKYITLDTLAMSWTSALLNNDTPVETARYRVGFGWRIGKDWDGRQVFHHAGSTSGARSILSINKEQSTSVAFLSNAQWVSRMETTGEMIATAASESSSLTEADCPAGRWRYSGYFVLDADNPPFTHNASGKIEVAHNSGLCHGRIIPDNILANWLRENRAKITHIPITLVTVKDGNTRIFAATTPWGAFPTYWTNVDEDAVLTGDIAGRSIHLSLSSIEANQ